MSQTNATAHESSASEAVVSKDGRIQRRIRNYETVVINIAEGNASTNVNKATAINDDYTDIPVLLDSVEIDQESRATTSKPTIWILGSIVVITFLWSMYSLFFMQQQEQVSASLPTTTSAAYDVDHAQKIKQLSDLILQDNDWNDSRLTSIMQHWNKLKASDRNNLHDLSWFQHFNYEIKAQLKEQTKLMAASHPASRNTALHKLAVTMGITNSEGLELENSGSSAKYQELVNAIKNEIAQAELSSRQSQQSTDSEEKLNTLLRQELAVSNDAINRITITDAEIKTLLDKYKIAYESGNLTAISKLFGLDLSANVGKPLRGNFENVFRNTAKRSINFYDYSWEPTANGAVINSKYNGMLEFASNKGTQHIVANAKIIALQKGNQLHIASFELLDSKVSVVAPRLDISEESQADTSNKQPAVIPNAAQLQDLTMQLVAAYEAGNIEKFIALFSEDAKTNDRIDLSGIRADYSQLFQTTTDRQMFIQNLQWTDASIGAKGIGDLEVVVLSNNTNTVYTMKGKIQIVAQQFHGKTRITHLYHIERQK
jgi:hypothetical protein